MPQRPRALALAGALLMSVLLAGCVNADPKPSGSSNGTPLATVTALPTPTIGPGNESTSKGEPPAPVPVEPVLVYAGLDGGSGTIGASGYIAGVIENDGECTFTFTKGSTTEQVTSEGLADVSTTSCGNVELPAAKVTSGTWSVVLEYRSTATAAVSSAPSTVEVP
ncbi:hypothetical protein [Plantibacter sp. YIM 135347]|uniref:hypothetical protein n=1 Tax=Plantibacter sp. YIM 135347 TaxID=3423919 RepID=UPI003D329636